MAPLFCLKPGLNRVRTSVEPAHVGSGRCIELGRPGPHEPVAADDERPIQAFELAVGNIWFADPLAGIDIAGTIGTVDIATNVASEYATPLLKTTIQISARTSQDQSCDTGTAVCTPVPTGTCVALTISRVTAARAAIVSAGSLCG